jgi:hypothetical protein
MEALGKYTEDFLNEKCKNWWDNAVAFNTV